MLSTDKIYKLAESIASDYAELNDSYYERVGEIISELRKKRRKEAEQYWMLLLFEDEVNRFVAEYMRLNKKTEKSIRSVCNKVEDYVVKNSDGSRDDKLKDSISEKSRKFLDDIIQYEILYGDLERIVRITVTGQNLRSEITKFNGLSVQRGKFRRDIETTVRSLVLWAAKQVNLGIEEKLFEKGWADGYEIDYHANPRPSHAYMGGKQFVVGHDRIINGKLYESFERVAEPRLNDPNCLHFKWAVKCGITPPKHSDDELEALKREDEKQYEYEGKKYTKYEVSQVQRYYENEVRKAEKVIKLAKKAGEKDIVLSEQAKIKRIGEKYRRISKAFDMPTKKL